MTIWVYFIIGLLEAVGAWLFDISTTEPAKTSNRIVYSIILMCLWPLKYVLMAAIAIYCRVDPQHRFLLDLVEKD